MDFTKDELQTLNASLTILRDNYLLGGREFQRQRHAVEGLRLRVESELVAMGDMRPTNGVYIMTSGGQTVVVRRTTPHVPAAYWETLESDSGEWYASEYISLSTEQHCAAEGKLTKL